MKKFIYYLIWIICVVLAMVIMSTLLMLFLEPDSLGVKGLTAGAGLAFLYARKDLFKLFDKVFFKKKK